MCVVSSRRDARDLAEGDGSGLCRGSGRLPNGPAIWPRVTKPDGISAGRSLVKHQPCEARVIACRAGHGDLLAAARVSNGDHSVSHRVRADYRAIAGADVNPFQRFRGTPSRHSCASLSCGHHADIFRGHFLASPRKSLKSLVEPRGIEPLTS